MPSARSQGGDGDDDIVEWPSKVEGEAAVTIGRPCGARGDPTLENPIVFPVNRAVTRRWKVLGWGGIDKTGRRTGAYLAAIPAAASARDEDRR